MNNPKPMMKSGLPGLRFYAGRAGLAFFLIAILMAVMPSVSLSQIPQNANFYRIKMVREARLVWGLKANVALFAAQIHQESSWDCNARSRFADGCAQFTPSTAKWMGEIHPELGEPDPFNADWALPAALRLNKRNYQNRRHLWADECSATAGMLSIFNGGFKYLLIEIEMAHASVNHQGDVWFGNVEMMRARADWAYKENRGYPRRILFELLPRYLRAGWPGSLVCGSSATDQDSDQ